MLLYHRPVPAKIPKRRSRAGCVHCKEKKKKCNEERPQCDRCMERGLKCEYEPVKPRKRRRTVSNPEHFGMRPPTTAPGQHLGFHDRLQALRQDSSSGSSILSGSPTPPLPAIAEGWEVHSAHSVFSDSGSSPDSDTLLDMHSPLPPFDPLGDFPRTMAELSEMKPLHMDPMDGYVKYEDDVHTTQDMFVPASALSRSTSYPDPSTAFIPPTSGASPYDFAVPAFSEFTNRESRRGLLDHFCNVLSHLIVFKEDTGNPFRQLVLPIAQKSPPLLNAIYAISSAHLEHRDLQVEERALDLHSKALQGLANLIAHKDEGNRDEVLAVIILLLYYELVRVGSSTVLSSHLRGALSIMRERRTRRSATSTFLERSFRYFDVTSALSFFTAPISTTLLSPPPPPTMLLPHENPYIASIDSLFGLIGDLWPLLHRLASLTAQKPLIEAEEHTSPGSEKAVTMRMEFDTNVSNLELVLQQWTPKFGPNLNANSANASQPEIIVGDVNSISDDSRFQSVINNAEAHKQCALIHLQRNLTNHSRRSPHHAGPIPSSSAQIQTPVKQALQSCLRVVIFSGPMTTLLWPLFTASVEAVDEVDREVARTVWRNLESRQGMGNIVTAWEVCEELWRRGERDGEGVYRYVDWRSVAADMGKEVIFG